MGELKFTHGVMGSHKTADALMQHYSLKSDGFNVLLLKPSIDNRAGATTISSRAGLSAEAFTYDPTDSLYDLLSKHKPEMIIVDEAQFSTPNQIDELREYSIKNNASVFAYGLKTDFRTHLFPGSQRLLEVADRVDEIETMCSCGKHKATVSARLSADGNIVTSGDVVEIGGDERYKGMCYECFLTGQLKTQSQEEKLSAKTMYPLLQAEKIVRSTDKAVGIYAKTTPNKTQMLWIAKSQANIEAGHVLEVTGLVAGDNNYLKKSIALAITQASKKKQAKVINDLEMGL